MKKPLFITIITTIILLALSACSLINIQSLLPATQSVVQAQLEDANPTTTTTPFQPIEPTATHTITPIPTPTETLVPTIPQPTATSASSYEDLRTPEDQINIMVIGNDYRPAAGYRTDVMVLVSINPKQKIVNAISFPRDLYVQIPGRGLNRLNTAFPFGGFILLQQTMEANFHVRPDYYIMTNFNGFANIINSLGGIEVNCERNLYDACDLPQAVNGYCSAGPGIVLMNGETALWYVRSRYTTSDFDRNRRQQEVLMAILKRFMSLDVVTRASELFDAYKNSVETDLDLGTIIKLIPLVPSLSEPGHLNSYYISQSYVTNWMTENGAAVLLPNQAAIEQLIRQVIYSQ